MSGPATVAREFAQKHPAEAAGALGDFSIAQVVPFVSSLSPTVGAKLLRHMPPHRAASCLNALAAQSAADMLATMSLGACAFLLRRTSVGSRDGIRALLPEKLGRAIGRLLDFAENTAGDFMDPAVFTVYADMTAEDALLQARKEARRMSHHIPVVDRDYVFQGVVTVKDLMLASPRKHVGTFLRDDFKIARASAPLEHIRSLPQWEMFRELPVVDTDGVLLGMLQESSLTNKHGMSQSQKGSGREPGAAKALGELFWLGMAAVVTGASSIHRAERDTEPLHQDQTKT